jgi:hypothetical protein
MVMGGMNSQRRIGTKMLVVNWTSETYWRPEVSGDRNGGIWLIECLFLRLHVSLYSRRMARLVLDRTRTRRSEDGDES